MNESVSPETLARQHRQVDHFISFCVDRNLQPVDISPPGEPLLCDYAHSFAGKVSGATARSYITAVKKWSLLRGFRWTGGVYLERTLKGVENRTPSSSIQEERSPVREEHLQVLQEQARQTPNDGFIRCRNAAAFVMFYGQMRAGEALSKNVEVDKYESHLPRVKDLAAPNDRGARILKLPKTKTQRIRGDQVIISPLNLSTSPTWAIRKHIEVNSLQGNDPLFAYRDTAGVLHVLTKKLFLKSCNEDWRPRQIPCMTGHCFRIGGTTHYLLSGVAPDVVKALGRWRSDTFLRYWRNIEELARVHLPVAGR
ncbi:hypothetical protein F5878DRAFT_548800 [Lentinula raphanica]|uniref:DNA breaking-rejoining enzyme n=1 Tax=Lentinula raphanica TaxID=153919 RepID=A0AA38NWU0_9AGAR|nr:hypothetical protein F5878DRAFT_548800 [Lentinula raphanica]